MDKQTPQPQFDSSAAQPPPYSALSVAQAFLTLAKEKGKYGYTNMQLQKLVYFAHGYYLAYYAKPLIREKIQAWKLGPVIPELYYACKLYKDNIVLGITDPIEMDEKAKNTIKSINKAYGGYNALQLSGITHQQGPWTEAYDGRRDRVIERSQIEDYYKDLVSRVSS